MHNANKAAVKKVLSSANKFPETLKGSAVTDVDAKRKTTETV